jgi:tetratricopeptide (TPR) repeat protein
LNPRAVDGYVKLGEAQFHLALEKTGAERVKQLENARHEFEVADKLRPSAEAANGLGMLELQRRNGGAEAVRAAAADFQLAVERDASYGPALLNLGILCQQHLNQLAKALQLYRQYVSLQPPPPNAKEVAKLVVQLDLDTRVTIGHDSSEQRAPSSSSRIIITPTNSTPATPKAAPAEHPSTKVTKPVPGPAPTSEVRIASVPVQSPQPPPTPPPKAAATPVASDLPAESPSPAVTLIVTPTNDIPAPQIAAPQAVAAQLTVPQDGVPQSVVPPPSAQQREPFVEKLNPLHWFSSKTKSTEAAPVPKGTRYKYPPRITPIPGNRREAARLAEQGAEARKAGDLDVALRKLSESANADATYFDAELALGETAIDTGDYDSAMTALYRALGLDEDSAEARYAFAWVLQRRGYYIDAARELERLLEAHPDDARGHLLLGNLDAEKLGLPKQARQHYARVLELDPGNSQIPAIRAWILKTP